MKQSATTPAKRKATARANPRRRSQRAETLARMEEAYDRHLKGEDSAPEVTSGKVGDVHFDDAITTQRSSCMADSADDEIREQSLVVVDIDISPDGHAHIQINSEMDFASATRQHLELNWHQLEPLAVALSRAVENAKARGFLP